MNELNWNFRDCKAEKDAKKQKHKDFKKALCECMTEIAEEVKVKDPECFKELPEKHGPCQQGDGGGGDGGDDEDEDDEDAPQKPPRPEEMCAAGQAPELEDLLKMMMRHKGKGGRGRHGGGPPHGMPPPPPGGFP